MLEILNETRRLLPLARLERALTRYLDETGVVQTVTLILCDDAAIHELNLAHRGVNAPTDVLSYPLLEPDDANMPVVEQLGDVFVSLDTAEAQAAAHGNSFIEEVLVLSAHGITHLRGFDHPTEAAWQIFHTAQTRVKELFHGAL